jgi:hypothetical protein
VSSVRDVPGRLVRAVRGEDPRRDEELRRLRRRVTRLEDEIQEVRGLNVRLAELTDIVGELLLPVASRDEERLTELLSKYGKDL